MTLTSRGRWIELSTPLALMLSTVVALGCGSSSGPGYGVKPGTDAGTGIDAPTQDAGPDVPAVAPPLLPGNVSVFAGTAELLNHGQPCTSEIGATSDRWCAFISSSTTNLGLIDMFVFNVSRATAGTAVACGASFGDPNCLHLTGGLFQESSSPFPHAARFVGDTLLYTDVTGTAYAWRPGMSDGLKLAKLSAQDLHDCTAAPRGRPAVACLQDLQTQPASGETHSTLLAGFVDGATALPLVPIDEVISANPADGTNLTRFQVGFPTPTGNVLAWSSRATATGPEILKTQTVGGTVSPVTVATDVHRFAASPDGSSWYWLSQFGTTSGTLQTAPFPGGANPSTMLASVRTYQVLANGALAVVSSAGALGGINDPVGAPATVTAVDTAVAGLIGTSNFGDAVYAKMFNSILGFVDLYVKKLDGTGTRCTLTAQVDGERFAAFAPAAASVLWARVDLNATLDAPPSGIFTSLASCKTTTLAPAVTGLAAAGDQGVLFTDDLTNLKLQNVTGGGVLDTTPASLLQTGVDGFAPVFPNPGAVVFTVNTGFAIDGVYVHAVASSPATGTDAGLDGAGTDGGPDGANPDGASPDGPAADGATGDAPPASEGGADLPGVDGGIDAVDGGGEGADVVGVDGDTDTDTAGADAADTGAGPG